jgi:hypothetical protein
MLTLVGVLAACGSEESGPETSTGASGVLEPMHALELAEQSGAIPSTPTQSSSAPGGEESEDRPPPLIEERNEYISGETGAEIKRSASEGLRFPLRLDYAATVVPIDLASEVSGPVLVDEDRGIFYANAYPSTDIVLTQFLGLNETLLLRGPDAPEEFSWMVTSTDPTVRLAQRRGEPVGLLRRFHGGGSGEFVGGFVYVLTAGIWPASPHDSSISMEDPLGKEVPARLKASSSERLTLTVDHREQELQYPVSVELYWQTK